MQNKKHYSVKALIGWICLAAGRKDPAGEAPSGDPEIRVFKSLLTHRTSCAVPYLGTTRNAI